MSDAAIVAYPVRDRTTGSRLAKEGDSDAIVWERGALALTDKRRGCVV